MISKDIHAAIHHNVWKVTKKALNQQLGRYSGLTYEIENGVYIDYICLEEIKRSLCGGSLYNYSREQE